MEICWLPENVRSTNCHGCFVCVDWGGGVVLVKRWVELLASGGISQRYVTFHPLTLMPSDLVIRSNGAPHWFVGPYLSGFNIHLSHDQQLLTLPMSVKQVINFLIEYLIDPATVTVHVYLHFSFKALPWQTALVQLISCLCLNEHKKNLFKSMGFKSWTFALFDDCSVHKAIVNSKDYICKCPV